MKLVLEVSTKQDAQEALSVLKGFLGIGSEVVEEAPKKVARKAPVKKEVEEDDVEEEKPAPKKTVRKKAAPKITVKSLQELAKAAIAESDKETVKGIISEYGENISSIDEADYDEFKAKLEEITEEV